MSEQSLTERLFELRQKYIDDPVSEELKQGTFEQSKRIKKKLMTLEMERCQLKMAHRDHRHVDERIASLKQACRSKNEGG
ncbi:hypothetical protein ACMZ62_05460 [Streptococcus pluranimalium]|uniref:hypothetical protein n=1 Tax=Streptococcus hyovaginalis TaxID=149015 RepID=UPI003AE380D3